MPKRIERSIQQRPSDATSPRPGVRVEAQDFAGGRVPRDEGEHAVVVDGDEIRRMSTSPICLLDPLTPEETAPRGDPGRGQNLTDGRRIGRRGGTDTPRGRLGAPGALTLPQSKPDAGCGRRLHTAAPAPVEKWGLVEAAGLTG